MRPENEADLAAMIRAANAPLRIRGGGTRLHPGEDAPGLDMRGLTGITLYEPAALTLVARAGTPLAEIEAVLAADGQMLGFEPDPRAGSTIGGVAGANASGSRRLSAGACRDAMLGVRFVTGTGAEIIPVVSLCGREIGTGKPGPITRKLLEAFRNLTQTEGTEIYETAAQS